MSLAILFHFLCAQHVSDINISIIRSLWLFCWITALVVLFLVRCVLEFRYGWVGVTEACNTDTTPNQPHRNSNTHRTKNNTTNVVIQQNSRKLLVMNILMFETCWAHKKWNQIASDIKLVFYSSAITMMHGPINIRFPLKKVQKAKNGNICWNFCRPSDLGVKKCIALTCSLLWILLLSMNFKECYRQQVNFDVDGSSCSGVSNHLSCLISFVVVSSADLLSPVQW